MSKLEKINKIDSAAIDKQNYMSSLVQEACSKGIIGEYELEKISASVIDMLSASCFRLTKGDSTSVRAETAAKLAESCLYKINLALLCCDSPEKALEKLLKTELSRIEDEGCTICKALLNDTESLYKVVQKNSLKLENKAYTVLNKTFKKYLSTYDAILFAAAVPEEIDYPLYRPIIGKTGIEFANEYLLRLNIENRFCSRFKAESIQALLNASGCSAEDSITNIFSLVITNALGAILCGKSCTELLLEEQDISQLTSLLRGKELQDIESKLYSAYSDLCTEQNKDDSVIKAYFFSGLDELAKRCRLNPKGVFIYTKSDDNAVIYTPFSPMNRYDFAVLCDEIIYSDSLDEKIRLIREEIKSIYDISELFENDALSEDELIPLLRGLDEISVAVLLKLNPMYTTGKSRLEASLKRLLDDEYNDNEREACEALAERIVIKEE